MQSRQVEKKRTDTLTRSCLNVAKNLLGSVKMSSKWRINELAEVLNPITQIRSGYNEIKVSSNKSPENRGIREGLSCVFA